MLRQKRGVLGTGQARKRGVLGTGQARKRGVLRLGYDKGGGCSSIRTKPFI